MRWALIEAVAPAVRADRGLRRYYERIKQRRGPNAAKVATARRLLTIVYRVLTQERHYLRSVGQAWRVVWTALHSS